jgi:hypothetical protein
MIDWYFYLFESSSHPLEMTPRAIIIYSRNIQRDSVPSDRVLGNCTMYWWDIEQPPISSGLASIQALSGFMSGFFFLLLSLDPF